MQTFHKEDAKDFLNIIAKKQIHVTKMLEASKNKVISFQKKGTWQVQKVKNIVSYRIEGLWTQVMSLSPSPCNITVIVSSN